MREATEPRPPARGKSLARLIGEQVAAEAPPLTPEEDDELRLRALVREMYATPDGRAVLEALFASHGEDRRPR